MLVNDAIVDWFRTTVGTPVRLSALAFHRWRPYDLVGHATGEGEVCVTSVYHLHLSYLLTGGPGERGDGHALCSPCGWVTPVYHLHLSYLLTGGPGEQ